MKCINCGAEIKEENKKCPYCGAIIQMVPDYSVYDEDDINIILESTKETTKKSSLTKEEKAERRMKKQKAAEEAKKRKTQLIKKIVLITALILIVFGIIFKVIITIKNNNSFSYQMKQADGAMFKGNIEEAEKHYLKALELEPDNVNVRLELADLYIEKENNDRAEKYLKEVIKKEKDNYDAYRMLYAIYSEEGNTKAILELKKGITDNRILAIFSDYNVDTALISVPGGTYKNNIKIYISAKKDVEIYYTIDGKNPTSDGIKYKGAFEITGAGMHTLKVATKNELGVYSDVVTETYIIEYEAPADPVVTPNGGTFSKETYVYITVPSGCSAYYTWDRTDPTTESSKYISPILIPEGKNMLTVIIIHDETGLSSAPYRGLFTYTSNNSAIDE